MKCPGCGAENRRRDDVCYQCGRALPKRPAVRRTPAMAAANVAMWFFFILIALLAFGALFYRVYFWIAAWRFDRYYKYGGRMEPVIEEIDMDYGVKGHAVTIFSKDGDRIFIKEMEREYAVTGGLARIEIEDNRWFTGDTDSAESANVTLTPIVYHEDASQSALPPLTMEIAAPESPLVLINPPAEYAEVNTSIYPLSFQVVPDSEVYVGGASVADMVDYAGVVSVNVNVYPIGDNPISLLVRTPNHRETRLDINLYRAYQEITLEPSLNLPKKTNQANVKISGTVDPTATFSVDTAHVANSVRVEESGSFSFIAKMELIGDNIITFRATKEGAQDAVVSVRMYYVPTLDAYSRQAWRMDYPELKLYYDTWIGRVFLCKGEVLEVTVDEDEVQHVVMDVSTDGTPQYVVLENYSSVGSPAVGSTYSAYADVLGSYFYADTNCPLLACRYMLPVSDAG